MARPINAIRKLTRTGSSKSLAVVIPADIIRFFGWRQKQRVQVTQGKGSVIIRDAKTKKRKKKK
jgi:bifunctional DNA-binding transcriptional regulator/antitoxin component of YhaV-PrlF toxin-antitoxin module